MSKERIKIGDKVKCISKSEYGYTGEVGDIFVVKILTTGCSVVFENDDDVPNDIRRFELYKEASIPEVVKKDEGWGDW